MGGGQPQDAAQLLVLQPVLWAALIGLALNTLALPLPRSLEAVTAALAPANKPLMLLSAGMMMQPVLPQSRQVGGRVWVARLCVWLGCVGLGVQSSGKQAVFSHPGTGTRPKQKSATEVVLFHCLTLAALVFVVLVALVCVPVYMCVPHRRSATSQL